jgi:hypothetical protein
MAQQNHNISYLTEVDGITIWERLRVIRNFLAGRRRALALAEYSADNVDRENFEAVIMLPELLESIEYAKDEVNFLTKLEATLAAEAELTRIEGKTDREMYEINFFEESIQRSLLTVQAEVMTLGRVSTDTMKSLLKNPYALDRCIELGFLSPEVKNVLTNSKSPLLLLNNTQQSLLPKEALNA